MSNLNKLLFWHVIGQIGLQLIPISTTSNLLLCVLGRNNGLLSVVVIPGQFCATDATSKACDCRPACFTKCEQRPA